MFFVLGCYFCRLQPSLRKIYSTFSISNKLKRNYYFLILLFQHSVFTELFLLSRSLSRFRAFSTIFRASLRTASHTSRIQRTANNVITDARKILHTTTANQHDGVFLQVVAFSRNIRVHFLTIR